MIQSWCSPNAANLPTVAQRAPAERLCAFTLTVVLSRFRFGDGGVAGRLLHRIRAQNPGNTRRAPESLRQWPGTRFSSSEPQGHLAVIDAPGRDPSPSNRPDTPPRLAGVARAGVPGVSATSKRSGAALPEAR